MKFTIIINIYTIIFLSSFVVAAPSDESDEDQLDDENVIQTRVLGGRLTQSYAHIVSLQKSKKPYCGGSIITQSWILTSAWCKSGNVEALAGAKNLKISNRRAQRRIVELFIGNEDFDRTVQQSANDIALAKVETPFDFSNNKLVSTIDLPIPFEYPKGYAYVAGWGKYLPKNNNNNDSPVLRHAQVPVYSQSSCSILWSPSNYTDTNCCAGSLNGDGTACTSDAGGPLMSEISTRPLRYTLVGIVSWTQANCGQSGKPGVYTLVSNYIDWIKTKIEENP